MVYLHQATGFIIVNVNYRGFQKVWELCKSNLTLRRFLKWADVLEECLHEYTMTVVNPAEIPGLNLIEMCLRDISEGVVIFRRRAHT
jgi:hypothetical protein